MSKHEWWSLALGIPAGCITSVLVWGVIWLCLRPKCVFSTQAVLGPEPGIVRVKICNSRQRGLVDLTISAVVWIPNRQSDAASSPLLTMPLDSPILPALGASKQKNPRQGFSHQILILDVTRFFSIHSSRLDLLGSRCSESQDSVLEFLRLLTSFPDANFQIALAGTDNVSSARRVMWSPRYTATDCVTGRFAHGENLSVLSLDSVHRKSLP